VLRRAVSIIINSRAKRQQQQRNETEQQQQQTLNHTSKQRLETKRGERRIESSRAAAAVRFYFDFLLPS